MDKELKYIYDKVCEFAESALDGIDPEKTQVSFQLEKLKPVMITLSEELKIPVEDVFIKYMDAASEASVVNERKFQSTVGEMSKYGDPMQFEKF
ncbi:MAG: hypothetical protein MJ123_02850 [Lachnospiraceae bacterium]|nr:hypothetical protein [Lachnospiraceae bacterium]